MERKRLVQQREHILALLAMLAMRTAAPVPLCPTYPVPSPVPCHSALPRPCVSWVVVAAAGHACSHSYTTAYSVRSGKFPRAIDWTTMLSRIR